MLWRSAGVDLVFVAVAFVVAPLVLALVMFVVLGNAAVFGLDMDLAFSLALTGLGAGFAAAGFFLACPAFFFGEGEEGREEDDVDILADGNDDDVDVAVVDSVATAVDAEDKAALENLQHGKRGR